VCLISTAPSSPSVGEAVKSLTVAMPSIDHSVMKLVYESRVSEKSNTEFLTLARPLSWTLLVYCANNIGLFSNAHDVCNRHLLRYRTWAGVNFQESFSSSRRGNVIEIYADNKYFMQLCMFQELSGEGTVLHVPQNNADVI
jgi:hypothetical protein